MSETIPPKMRQRGTSRTWPEISPELFPLARQDYQAYAQACFKQPNCTPVPFQEWVKDWLKSRETNKPDQDQAQS